MRTNLLNDLSNVLKKGTSLSEKGTSLNLLPKMDRECIENDSRMDRQSLGKIFRYAAVLFMLFMVGIGNVWGAEYSGTVTFYTTGGTLTTSSITNSNASVAFTYSDLSASSSTKICNVSSRYGIKGKNTKLITVSCPSGYYFKSAKFTLGSFGNTETPTAQILSGSTTLYTCSAHTYTKMDDAECGDIFSCEDSISGFVASKYTTLTVKETGNSKNLGVVYLAYTIASVAPCSDPAAPDGLSAGSITTTGATFTISDDESPASYDIYYSTESDEPTGSTVATTTSTSKTKAVTGLTVGTTYYAWVRAVCDGSHKSSWVALTSSTFTTKAQYTITYDKGANGTGTISAGTKTEGEDFTLSSSVFTRASYAQTGWATSDGGSKVYDLGGTYSTDAAITLYPVWTATTTYTFDYSNSKSISTLEGEGWTFNSSSTTSMSADGEFVNLVKTFNDNKITTPKSDGSGNDYSLAFAKSTDAYAKFDLGGATTVTSLTGSMKVGTNGSSTAWKSITIKFLGSDGSTVKATYTKDHSTASWTADALSYTTPVADVQYIQIQGANKWQILDQLNITYVPVGTCIGNYSFHYGTNEQSDWTVACFEDGSVTDERVINNFTIPTVPDFWVGWQGSPLANDMTVRHSWNDDVSDLGNGVMNGAMVLNPVGGTAKVGWAQGAVGKLTCWYGSKSKNQYVNFTPNGYAVMYGGNNYAFSTTATSHMLETDVVTLPDVSSTTYQVGIATASSYVTCAHSKAAENINAMGVTTIDGGLRKIWLYSTADSWIGSNAKMAIWDATNSHWGDNTDAHKFMTKVNNNLWYGFVPTDAETIILVRVDPSNDDPAWGWGQSWNVIPGDLNNYVTITGSWSTDTGDSNKSKAEYTISSTHPATGDKGKFRMWDNSSSQNWYVHWIPYYVLMYDANGGTGTTAQTERNSESSTLTVNTAANGFTAPTGYEFAGWATSDDRADAGTVDYAAGASYTLTANATLYAVWRLKTYDVTTTLTNVTVSSGTTGTDAATYGTAYSVTFAGSTGYNLPGSVIVMRGETNITANCTWTQATGVLSIPAAQVTGDIAITVTGDVACSAHGLTYATASVEKNVGDAAFTNTLTNPNSLSVSYSSSVPGVATVNTTSGMVTIVGAGSTVITATFAGDATYCAGTATYTLTVSSGCTPQSIVKTQLSSTTAGTTTGYNDDEYASNPVIATFEDTKLDGGYKLKSGSKLFITLKKGNFVAGDKINIVITKASDLTNVGKLLIFYDASSPKLLTTIDAASANTYTYTLTAANITTLGSTKTIGVYRPSSGDYVSNPYVKSVEVEGCREWTSCTAPDAVAAGSVTATGATFTITDAENTNNYEIYYSTSSTAPTAGTSATVSGISTKSRTVTGLTAETTYYYWVRSNCGGVTKSSWVAGTPASFTTAAAAATNSVTYNGNGSTGGSVPTDATAYEEGDIVTVKGNTGSLVKTSQTFLGWSTNATPSSGTFYPAGYKFYMPNEAVTLYAVWGSAAEEKYYYGSITITAGALTPGSTGTKGFFTNSGGTIATSSAISLSSTPSEAGYYYESSTLTHTALNKSSNWNTSSTAKRTIRAFKFKSGSSYTLALGSKTATSIMFYGKCGSASKTMTVGGVNYESPSTSDKFFSHEYTKVGNFTGNVTITQDGDFYGILVVTVSTGAGSNHTVTFNMNGKGSAIEPITDVPDGSKIGAPVPSPTAVGAEFGGWYNEEGCSTPWIFATGTITADKTLYAKWTTCAPTISVDPSGNTYTQGAAASAMSVTASGDGISYQWYSSETNETIEGASAIPSATSASYTPSTSLLGTTYYFCVVSNTCGNAVSNFAAITVNDGRPTPTAVWTGTEARPKSGGKGWTVTVAAKKNDGSTKWDGDLTTSMLSASTGVTLSGLTVDNTNKTITGTYSLPTGVASPITFTLTLPASETQAAAALTHNVSFTPCAGGAGDSYNVRVRKDYEKDASNNYRWVTAGAGEITYAVNSSISSAKASSAVGVFDSIMSNDKQYVWVKTYVANTKTVRLHVLTGGKDISVSNIYKNTSYVVVADEDIVSSDAYSVSYDGSGSAEDTGAKGTHYIDITFNSPLAANDIICVMFSKSNVKAYGAVLTTVGDGGDQTTSLAWNTPAPDSPVTKNEDAADFSFTAKRNNTEAEKSLGEISYSSSNTAVATVNATTGLVHIADAIDFGAADYKEVTITASLAASGCYKKASITYTLRVNKYVCTEAAGTVSIKTDVSCSEKVLTVTGFEADATFQWQKDGVDIPLATSQDYTATTSGEYSVVTTKTCAVASTNSIKLSIASATAEKIVDQWYVKNGRRTPDIALVQTTGATSFTVTSGGTITEIGGCTFELKKDGIIYLHGQKEDGSAPSDMIAGDMPITITVSGCSGALSGLDITLHIQAETAKPSVAFVVDGTLRKDGGTATSVSEAKTSDRPLWTYLSSSYALTGCNVYWSVDSKELREYYSQFDAILITDDPSTYTKGAGDVEYVKAFGTMVDVRPILTLEAYVGRYSDGGWHVYNADPTSPNPRQVEMKLECKNHDIFKGLDPNASDNVRVETDAYGNEYWYVIMVDTTVAPYHNTSKDYKALPALQGFDKKKFSNMLGVGTIADETLQAGVERQEEPAARMMILGIQNEAMAALTNEGKLIVKNAIEYLLKTNMEDVNDCANYFTDETGNGLWNDAGNWSSNKVPDFESRVRILKPVVVPNGYQAIVARVDIATSGKSKWIEGTCNGSVTINPQGALIVGGKIRRADAPHYGIDDLMPTQNNDLIVKAATTSTHYQGALIFDNSNEDTHAVVEMWNPSHWEVVDGKKKKYWSYVAVPIQEADIPNFFWYGFTYLYDETSGWIKKGDGTSLYPFQGIGASLQTGNMETFYGPLATTESQDITLTKTDAVGKGMNLIGNSWTAPIQIANFEEDDFGDATAEVWVFNTGHENKGTPGTGTSTTDGQWNTIPINAPTLPGYEGLKVIPAMQAFEVNTSSATTLHLDYDRLVRAGRENLNEPMRAPRRSNAAKDLEATMRVRVSGERTHTDVYLLKDARFSDTFDNGWDGHYLSGDDRSARLYAVSETEGALAFLAQPEIEGTILGFAPSRYGNDYTFSFYYLGEEDYYLNDIKLQKSTLISEDESYLFTYEAGDTNRFYISRTAINAPQVTTGVGNTGDGVRAKKFIMNDKMYILVNGLLYDATGKLINRK